jgi:hypothetical protein
LVIADQNNGETGNPVVMSLVRLKKKIFYNRAGSDIFFTLSRINTLKIFLMLNMLRIYGNPGLDGFEGRAGGFFEPPQI